MLFRGRQVCWITLVGLFPLTTVAQVYTPLEQTTFVADPALLLDYPDPRCTVNPCSDVRLVQITVRYPQGVSGPSPVVIWSHGGAGGNPLENGNDHSTSSLHEWGETVASAGYIAVNIAHDDRDATEREELCGLLNIPLGPPATPTDFYCEVFKYLNYDRPNDIARVLNHVDELAVMSPAVVDNSRIVMAGHSAGSGAALTVAGAIREFGVTVVQPFDSRPVGFMAFSPQSAGQEGFFDTDKTSEHSWQDINRPVLVGTGAGDSSCSPRFNCRSGDGPWGRRMGFGKMPAGDKYLLFLRDYRAPHGLFGDGASPCVGNGHPPADCEQLWDYVSGSALAFLDAYLKDHAPALVWLQQGTVETLSNGQAEWVSK